MVAWPWNVRFALISGPGGALALRPERCHGQTAQVEADKQLLQRPPRIVSLVSDLHDVYRLCVLIS